MLFLSLIIKSIETICIVYNFNAFLLRIILLYFRIIFPAIGWLAAVILLHFVYLIRYPIGSSDLAPDFPA